MSYLAHTRDHPAKGIVVVLSLSLDARIQLRDPQRQERQRGI
jgi:hypothetical protein